LTKFVLAIAKRVAEQYPCLFAETEAGKPCLKSDTGVPSTAARAIATSGIPEL
jgi:hypothetical protein